MSGHTTHAVERLQEFNDSISIVKKAPTVWPAKLLKTSMPLALVFPNNGQQSGRVGLRTDKRNYTIEYYMAPVTHGIRTNQLQQCQEHLDTFVEAYLGLLTEDEDFIFDYGITSGFRVELDREMISSASGFTDSGVLTDMAWEEQVAYYGFTLDIPLVVRWGDCLL